MGCRNLKSGDFKDQESESLVRCNPPGGEKRPVILRSRDPRCRVAGRGRRTPAPLGGCPHPRKPTERSLQGDPTAQCAPPPTPDHPQLPFLPRFFADLRPRVLFCNLLQVVFFFFFLPFLRKACLGFCPTRRLERAARLPLEILFPLPHDISGLYCNFPHGCPDTDSCVYENPLDTDLEPPWCSRLLLRLRAVCSA